MESLVCKAVWAERDQQKRRAKVLQASYRICVVGAIVIWSMFVGLRIEASERTVTTETTE